LSRALGLELPLVVFFALTPLVYVAMVLPISLSRLGVHEGTWTLFLSQFGVTTGKAVTLSFLIYLNRVVIGLLGACSQLVAVLRSRQPGSGHGEAGMLIVSAGGL
jgi:hypothetical protein